METVTDSVDESESSPGEPLRMNIPTLYAQSAFVREPKSRADSLLILTNVILQQTK